MTLLPLGPKGITIRVQELTFFHVFSHPGDLNMQIRFLQSDVFCFNIGVHRPSLPPSFSSWKFFWKFFLNLFFIIFFLLLTFFALPLPFPVSEWRNYANYYSSRIMVTHLYHSFLSFLAAPPPIAIIGHHRRHCSPSQPMLFTSENWNFFLF